jgi:hypothetical protein
LNGSSYTGGVGWWATLKTLNINVFGGLMYQSIEAMNNALTWIRNEWLSNGRWDGELSEVCDACDHDYGLTVQDIRLIAKAIKAGNHVNTEGFEVTGNKISVYKTGHFLSSTSEAQQDTLLTSPQPTEVNMSNEKNLQWRQNEKIAIARASRLSANLEKMLFVIYDNEEERYDIVDLKALDHLTTDFDLDFDLIAEVG